MEKFKHVFILSHGVALSAAESIFARFEGGSNFFKPSSNFSASSGSSTEVEVLALLFGSLALAIGSTSAVALLFGLLALAMAIGSTSALAIGSTSLSATTAASVTASSEFSLASASSS